jgi:hypothetical protein
MQELYGFIVASTVSRDRSKAVLVDMPPSYTVISRHIHMLGARGINAVAVNHHSTLVVNKSDDMLIGDAIVVPKDEFLRLESDDKSKRISTLKDYLNLECCLSKDSRIMVSPRNGYGTNVQQSRTWLPNSIAYRYDFCQTKIWGLVDLLDTNSYLMNNDEIFTVTAVKRSGTNKIKAEPINPVIRVRHNDLYVGNLDRMQMIDGTAVHGWNQRRVDAPFLRQTFPALDRFEIKGVRGIDRILLSFGDTKRTDAEYLFLEDYYLLEEGKTTLIAEDIPYENRRPFLATCMTEMKKFFGKHYPIVLIERNSDPDLRSYECADFRPVPLAVSRGSS